MTTPGFLGGSCLAAAGDYEQYGYDANGNRTSYRRRDGQTIAYTYDTLDRVTAKDLPAGPHVYYGYDFRRLQLYAWLLSSSGQGITNTYDGHGRQLTGRTTQGGIARSLSWQYDISGNRTRITHPGGHYFTYGYDGLDLVIQVGTADGRPAPVGELPLLGARPHRRRVESAQKSDATRNLI